MLSGGEEGQQAVKVKVPSIRHENIAGLNNYKKLRKLIAQSV